ncbi:hypothetical protein Q3G72_018596 [Acer saccharum]|nr:hypothetical protein Q3G72_018596 [Acer saccharum]
MGKDQRIATCIDILTAIFLPPLEAGGGENDGGKAHAPPYCSGLRRLVQASSLFDDVRRLAVSTVWAVRASLLVELLTAGGCGENDDGKVGKDGGSNGVGGRDA